MTYTGPCYNMPGSFASTVSHWLDRSSCPCGILRYHKWLEHNFRNSGSVQPNQSLSGSALQCCMDPLIECSAPLIECSNDSMFVQRQRHSY